MRYVSHISSLTLYNSMLPPNLLNQNASGTGYRPLYRFVNGELIIGDPTTATGAGNDIVPGTAVGPNPTPPEQLLMRIWSVDTNGRPETDPACNVLELCGLNRIFWAAPYIVLDSTNNSFTPPTAAGTYQPDPNVPALTYIIRYQVIAGRVQWNGQTYDPSPDGRRNIIRLENPALPGTPMTGAIPAITLDPSVTRAIIALTVPEPAEWDSYDQQRDILFRWKHLLVGDEAAWDPTQPGSYRWSNNWGWIR